MEEKRMLELADQLKELREARAAEQEVLKNIGAQLDAVEAQLIQIMTEQECSGFKRGDKSFSLVVKEYPGPVPECKAELYAAMREHGFEHLFTINAMTLSATIKELKANNDDELPDWLGGLVKIFEKPSIRVLKN